MFDNRKDEGTDRKTYRNYKQHSNAKYEVTITRNQGEMHQMKPKVYGLKTFARAMMGCGKRDVSGALHYFGLPGN